jgi:hypothetical protein
MINIQKATGIVTLTDTSYDFLPVVKFTVLSGQTAIVESSGLYNGHYYWELNLSDIVQGYVGISYIFYKNGDWNWNSALNGNGIALDIIQGATNTTYPLGTWNLTSAMTSSILISPATGLAKSYYNVTCSYTASSVNNMVYLKINNDSYEIPLKSLQVNSVSPSTLSESISLISALLIS